MARMAHSTQALPLQSAAACYSEALPGLAVDTVSESLPSAQALVLQSPLGRERQRQRTLQDQPARNLLLHSSP